jgi:hypothetical protein
MRRNRGFLAWRNDKPENEMTGMDMIIFSKKGASPV